LGHTPLIRFNFKCRTAKKKSEYKPINKFVEAIMIDDSINEMERAVSLMICYFWYVTLAFNSNDEKCMHGYGTQSAVNNVISQKIKENLNKIKKQELAAFSLDKIKSLNQSDTSMMTFDVINAICNKFQTETIKYHVGGSYYCGRSEYVEYELKANFGFIQL